MAFYLFVVKILVWFVNQYFKSMKKTICQFILVAIFILFATSDAFSYQEEHNSNIMLENIEALTFKFDKPIYYVFPCPSGYTGNECRLPTPGESYDPSYGCPSPTKCYPPYFE